MNCPCIPCTSRFQGIAPVLIVKKSRAAEIPSDVWRIIFKSLDLNSKLACTVTCKKWRYVLSKSPLLHPYYNIGPFECFKKFYKDFQKSRHIILLDTTTSMKDNNVVENGAHIIRKLIDFLEPAIKARGIHVGSWDRSLNVEHVKNEIEIINFFDKLSISGGITVFENISFFISEKLNTLDPLPTQVHIISDMILKNGSSIFLYPYKSKVTYRFYNVIPNSNPEFLSSINENSLTPVESLEPETKKRKKKNPVIFCIHPLSNSHPPHPHRPTKIKIIKGGVKKPHRNRGWFVDKIQIPPKRKP